MRVRLLWRGPSVVSLKKFLIRRPLRRKARIEFESPMRAPAHLAVLNKAFRPSSGLAVFECAGDPALQSYRPQALAGSLAQVMEVARMVEAGELHLPLEHSVTVFVSFYTGRLTDEIRDRLWRVFQVPVFEQLRGPSLELLAWECEAHDGLHTNDRGMADSHETCSCGVRGPKWRDGGRPFAVQADRAATAGR